MNISIKYAAKKWLLALFIVSGLFLSIENYCDAKFIKKISITPIQNPNDWESSFKPGEALTLILEKSLAKSGHFQLIPSQKPFIKKRIPKLIKKQVLDENISPSVKKQEKIDSENSFKQATFSQNHLSQIQVRGKILEFNPDIVPQKDHDLNGQIFRHIETAKIKAEIELINLNTGRSLAKKLFVVISRNGNIGFNSELSTLGYDLSEFKSSSIGKALFNLKKSAESFIINSLSYTPLVGNIIAVNELNRSALINLGKINGLKIQDVFIVLSMETKFSDPLNKEDLGDKFTRKGVIKLTEVQGRLSRAQIVSGLDLTSGDLVVPKPMNPERINENKLQEDVTWGAYKGLLSLSD